jgi:2-dehydropantoate 2-reductase
MKICVFGAGAIGGYMAVQMALAGHEVCVVARGPHLQAIRENGLKLLIAGEERIGWPAADSDPSRFGEQDLVICALKAHQAYESAPAFRPLLGPKTAFLTATNGIPWWYFYKADTPHDGRHLRSVDPGGRLWNSIEPRRAVGCIVEPACEIVAPGVIAHHQLNRFIIGEPDGSRSERIVLLSKTLAEAGFEAPVRDNIRWNIWLKLWGNVCFNPISALTGATLDRIVGDPSLRALCQTMMMETKMVNESLGIEIPLEMMKRRLDAAGAIEGHKMSMLQDLERGRSLEIDALVGAVQELGQLTGVATPVIDAVLALVKERARNVGLYAPIGS